MEDSDPPTTPNAAHLVWEQCLCDGASMSPMCGLDTVEMQARARAGDLAFLRAQCVGHTWRSEVAKRILEAIEAEQARAAAQDAAGMTGEHAQAFLMGRLVEALPAVEAVLGSNGDVDGLDRLLEQLWV